MTEKKMDIAEFLADHPEMLEKIRADAQSVIENTFHAWSIVSTNLSSNDPNEWNVTIKPFRGIVVSNIDATVVPGTSTVH